MDFQSAMETFAEAWVAANTKGVSGAPLENTATSQQIRATAQDFYSFWTQQVDMSQAMSLTRSPRSPPPPPPPAPPPAGTPSSRPAASPGIMHTPTPLSASPVSHKSSPSPAHHQHSSSATSEHGTSHEPMQANHSPASSKEAFEASKASSSGKSIPVHCVVEVLVPQDGVSGGGTPRRSRPVVETDSYAIIPVVTPFEDLVHVALYRLGYPRDCAHLATGSVVIKNWKPLRLERIADSPLLTVGDILGELTTVATLRIQLVRSRHSTVSDIKDKLLRLLLLQSHGLLLSSGCPLDEIFLGQLCRGQSPVHNPPEEMRRRFEQWVALHQQHLPAGTPPILGPSSASSAGPPPHPAMLAHSPSAAAAAAMSGHHHLQSRAGHYGADPRRLQHSPSKLDGLGPHPGLPEHVHPALQTVQSQYPTQKTRMRTSFDPELELPKLQRWFAENQHPSRHQIQQYVKELNSLESRRGRKPLDVNNVVYWFKNARAAQKRAELRLHLNGYSNGPMSMTPGLPPNHHHHALHHHLNSSGMSLMSTKSPSMSHHESAQNESGSNMMSIEEGSMTDSEDLRSGRGGMQTSPYSLVTSRNSLLSHLANREGHEDETDDDDVEDEEDDEHSPHPPSSPHSHHESAENPQNNSDSCSGPLQLTCKNNNNTTEATNQEQNSKDEIEIKEEPNFEQQPATKEEDMSDEDEEMRRQRSGSVSPRPNTAPSSLNPSSPPEEEIHRPSTPNSDFGPGALVPRGPTDRLGFPLVPNSMFSHSIMYMSHYIPGLQQHVQSAAAGLNFAAAAAAAAAASADDRRKRNRTFIDPVTEVPRLEQWFSLNTHPSHNLILKYTDELNRMPYRQKFPKLEPKNVQFWFKNRRAKCKRLKMSL